MMYWNPFEPRPEAVKIALGAYWQARRSVGNLTGGGDKCKTAKEVLPAETRQGKLARRKIQFGLDTFEVGESRKFPIYTLADQRQRLRQVQKIRAAITVAHFKTKMLFRTRCLDAELEVTRFL